MCVYVCVLGFCVTVCSTPGLLTVVAGGQLSLLMSLGIKPSVPLHVLYTFKPFELSVNILTFVGLWNTLTYQIKFKGACKEL